MTLRLKLLIAVIVLVFAGLAVSDVVTYTSLRTFLLKRVDQQLASGWPVVAHSLTDPHDPFGQGPQGSAPPLPPGTFGEFRDAAGNLIGSPVRLYGVTRDPAPSLPQKLPRPAHPYEYTTGAVGGSSLRYRVLVQPGTDAQNGQQLTLVVAVPLRELDQTLRHLLLIEGLVSALVVLGLGFVSWWLVRRGLRPLEEIGETAGAIAAGDLSRRVEPAENRTEVGRLGLALNSMLAQIEAAFEERRASETRLRRFVADASHELRTPLTSIRGYAELFRRGAHSRPEDLAKSMRRIEEEAGRMGVLVDDLLLLARLDQGRPLEREPLDLGGIVGDAVDSARAIEPDRPIDLAIDGPAPVLGDDGRLRQVVDNLLDNVRVHTPPATPIRVKLEAPDDEVVLSVADEGPGLTPEVALRVFERFYRGDRSRSRSQGGAGLGLSIVSAIVEAHGGKVIARSAGGAGTVFEVRLPAHRDRVPPALPPPDARPTPRRGEYRARG